MDKPIRLSIHARGQLRSRGVSDQEIVEAIRTAPWTRAASGKLECRKNFEYNQEWNKKWYSTKQVRPIFVDEKEEIIVVTVYSYYFQEAPK